MENFLKEAANGLVELGYTLDSASGKYRKRIKASPHNLQKEDFVSVAEITDMLTLDGKGLMIRFSYDSV